MKVIWFVAFALMTTTIFGQGQEAVLFTPNDLVQSGTESQAIQTIKKNCQDVDMLEVVKANLKEIGDPRGGDRKLRERINLARRLLRVSKVDKKQANIAWQDFTTNDIWKRSNDALFIESEVAREKASFAIDILEDSLRGGPARQMAYLFSASNMIFLVLGEEDWRIIGTGKIAEPIALRLTEEDTAVKASLNDRDKWELEDFFDKVTVNRASTIDPQDRDIIKRNYSAATYLWLLEQDDLTRESDECKKLKIDYINAKGGLKVAKVAPRMDDGAIPADGGIKSSIPDGHVAIRYDQPYIPVTQTFAEPWRAAMVEFYKDIAKEYHPRDRKWTTADGKYSMSGYMDGVEKTQSGKEVILVKDDGKRINVPYAKLSASDRNFCDVYEDMEMFNAPPKPESKQKKVKPKPSKRQPAGFGASNPG